MTPRPKATELVRQCAESFCADEGLPLECAKDVAAAYFDGQPHPDGYSMAKYLDWRCHWSVDSNTVDQMETFGDRVRAAHRQAIKQWAAETDPQPPLPVGTMTARGKIVGIYQYEPATYLVKPEGWEDDRHLLVKFEDVRPAESTGTAVAVANLFSPPTLS